MNIASYKKRWLPIIAGIVFVSAALFIYRINWVKSAKDRVFEILHLQKRVVVNNDSEAIQSSALMTKYYEMFGYNQTWSDREKSLFFREMLREMLNYADTLGLNPRDYHQDYIEKHDSLERIGQEDLAQFESENELIFTDAALSFLHDVAYGREIQVEFNGVNFNIDSTRLLRSFNDLFVNKNWRKTLDSLEPAVPQYRYLKTQLTRMKGFLREHPYLDSLMVADTDTGKMVAIEKLRFYGLVPYILPTDTTPELYIKNGIIGFQKMMNIDTTGKLDTKTIAALNAPVEKRLLQMRESLNYWRWTGRLAEREYILVNIPAARLQLINRDSIRELNMRVIVGKSATQTPSFTAYITQVIAYPYWTVPRDIAVKEMLPKIIKSKDYLDANNLQVLNNKGVEVDPSTIAWSTLGPNKFPYKIRQSTGCDNSLGVLKFDLNSPFFIYLHDTNRRDLFAKKDRFLSHGCIRLEKPMELANYILKDGLDSATTAKLNQCLHNETPTTFKLDKKIPVLLLYMTADVDEHGWLRFYNDVYKLELTAIASKHV